MKTKKTNKRLKLNKTTLANLDDFSLSKARGGDTQPSVGATYCSTERDVNTNPLCPCDSDPPPVP